MKPPTVDRLLDELDVVQLADRMHPALKRHEGLDAQRRGLHQVVRHTLRANQLESAFHLMPGNLELNPLAIIDRSGAPLAFLTDRSTGAGGSIHPRLIALPPSSLRHLQPGPWGTPPPFNGDLPIAVPDRAHLLAHPERWGDYTELQVRARLQPALRELTETLATLGQTVGHYYYIDTREPSRSRWSLVAPLRLARSGAPVPAVLNAEPDRFELVTILDRHIAYWNVAATGIAPPAWLDGTIDEREPAHRSAA